MIWLSWAWTCRTRAYAAGFDAERLAPLHVAHHVPRLVLRGPLAVRARDVLAGDEDACLVLVILDAAGGLHQAVDGLVDLHPRLIVWRHDQRPVRIPGVGVRDGGEPLLAVGDFVHAPLVFEIVDGPEHVAARQLLDDVPEGWVLLPDDLVQPDGLHSGLLELLIGAARLDRLMLADVAHEQHAVLGTEPLEELVHLLRARQARLIEHVEVLGSVAWGIGLREMALQGARGDAGLGQFVGGT